MTSSMLLHQMEYVWVLYVGAQCVYLYVINYSLINRMCKVVKSRIQTS